MNYIENESEFRKYVKKLSSNSKYSYLSRLNYLVKNGIPVNSSLQNNQVILDKLRSTENLRDGYKLPNDYSSLGSALNLYREFLSAKSSIEDDLQEIDKENVSETERELLKKARLGQGKFRNDLIELWGKCSVSGFEITEVLIASHILPWSKSSNSDRLNHFNGLLLLPNYDKMFDKGFISFNDDGSIILSKRISENDFNKIGINKKSKLLKVHPENIKYLKQHRNIYKDFFL